MQHARIHLGRMAVIVRAVLIALGLLVLHVAPGSASEGARLPFGEMALVASVDAPSVPAETSRSHDSVTDAGFELEAWQDPGSVHAAVALDPVAEAATLGGRETVDHGWLTIRQHRPPRAA